MVWFLLALIGFTYLINKITLNYGFSNLDYSMEIDKKTAEIGEDIEIMSIVENRKILTVSFLRLREEFPKGLNKKENIYSLFIMPYQRVRRTYKVFAEKRGLYSIKNVSLEVGDFIGFETRKSRVELDKELIVFPKKAELDESIVPFGSLSGDISVKRWIIYDPLMTIGIREYTGNEPERFIHWPSSIKYNQLMVKNFDFTTDNSVMVVLNVETMKPSWKPVEEELIERVISLTRGVMEEFEELKIPYGLACNAYNNKADYIKGYYNHPGLGQSHLNSLLTTLGRISYRIPFFFENTLMDLGKRKGNYTTIVIITPRILDSYIEHINSLSKIVNRTIVISLEEEYLGDLNNNIIKYRGR